MEKIKCTIHRAHYVPEPREWLFCPSGHCQDEQKIVGTFHEVTVGTVLTVEGKWRIDKR